MPARGQSVVFARINRRGYSEPPSGIYTEPPFVGRRSSFSADMTELAGSHQTSFAEVGTRRNPPRFWYAGDMQNPLGAQFMTGILGYATPEEHREFDRENWSWIQAGPEDTDVAREDTVAPFAIDLGDEGRWVSFAPAARLQPKTFVYGLGRVLTTAAALSSQPPFEWDVDLVVSLWRVNNWIASHPQVHKLRRTVKFTNPGRDFSADREEMIKLGARRKREEFEARINAALDISSEEFHSKLDGVDTGDIELTLQAGDAVLSNNNSPDRSYIDRFGGDLIIGMERVLVELGRYLREKQVSGQGSS
jgi:hypothetical protein